MPLTLLLVLAGCGDDDSSPETVTTTTAETTTSTTAAEPELELVDEAVDGFERREVTFANLTYTVLEAHVSNQELRSYVDGTEPVPSETTHLILDLRVENPTGRLIESDPDAISLEVGGDTSRVADDFLTDATGFIRPNSAVDDFLAFEIADDAAVSDAVLVLGASPDRAARLPLSGDVPASAFPVTFELSGTADGTGPTNGGTIRFELLDGALYEDLPHGDTTSPTGERADEGEIFLQLHLRATKIDGRGNDLLGVDAFRLRVDDVPRGPFDVAAAAAGSTQTPTAAPGVTVDAWILFAVDPGAQSYVLEAGDLQEGPGSIPVDLPEL